MKRNRKPQRKSAAGRSAQRSTAPRRDRSAAANVGAILLTGSFAIAQVPVHAAGGVLPVPCPGGSSACNGQAWGKLAPGATLATTPTSMTINQLTGTAIFNWSSFNISAGNSVTFYQPGTSSVALNRIFDPNISTINGNLKATGQIYLINPNGILFGAKANVNVAGLIASTSNLSDSRITSGLLYDPNVGDPVFTNDPTKLGASAAEVPVAGAGANPSIVVQPGATLYAAGQSTPGTVVSAGRIFLFAPTVDVGGSVKVDGGGQVIVAAGSNVYLGSSQDAALRGLLVEVNGSSAAGVSVDASGSISVARGNITLMGLAVNQAGRLSATSALDANGSILLLARQAIADPSNSTAPNDPSVLVPIAQTGHVTLASGSQTVVALDPSDTATAPLNDPTAAALQSTIKIQGATVDIGGNGAPGSTLVQANGGKVTVIARQASSNAANQSYVLGDGSLLGASDVYNADGSLNANASNINVNADAVIDVSGLQNVAVDSAAYYTYISRLTSTNLANAPFQRTGFLFGQGVYVNLNNVPSWLNVSALHDAVAGTQAQRNAVGGTVSLNAEGTVNLNAGSQVNVSGGSLAYSASVGRVSELITANGAIVPFSSSLSADTPYIGIAGQGSATVSDTFEGITQTSSWQAPTYAQLGGYTAGANAGTVQIYATAASLNGTLLGKTSAAQQQRGNLPQGGLLQIGSVNVSQLDSEAGVQRANILLADSAAALQQGLSSGLAAATATASGGASPVIDLNTGALTQAGFTRYDLTSDGAIEVAAGSPVNLGPGGSFVARGNAVAVDSSISAAGGSITLQERPLSILPGGVNDVGSENTQRDNISLIGANSPLRGSVTLGQGTALSVAGLWTNDLSAGPNVLPTGAVVLNGGSINVTGRTVDVSGASFDVSGGATLSQTGAFSGGAAGTMAIGAVPSDPSLNATTPPAAPQLNLGADFGARIAGYGTHGGGTLSLSAYGLQLGAGAPDPAAVDPSPVIVPTDIGNSGFQSFKFNGYDLVRVAPGTLFAPQVQSFVGNTALAYASSAASLRQVLQPQAALPGVAVPVRIAMSASANNESVAGVLDVGVGATLNAGTGGTISLTAGSGIQVDGSLVAPAGTVTLGLAGRSLDSSLTQAQLDARSIQLGPTGLIDVSGTSLVITQPNGLRAGSVLDAGNVSIDAPLGVVAIDPGARILAHGTTDTVDIAQPSSQYVAQTVASAGGMVEMSATNGLYLEGEIDAHGGNAGANGGILSLALNAVNLAGLSGLQTAVSQQLAPPTELVVGGAAPALTPGQASFVPPVDENGQALSAQAAVPLGVVNSSGFGQIWLQAADKIQFAQSMHLGGGALDALVLAAPLISVAPGAAVQIAAPYVALGTPYGPNPNSSYIVNSVPTTVPGSGGSGSLQVQAQNIDLVGDLGLAGAGTATLQASGDLRGIGLQGADGLANPTRASGSLSFGGNLNLVVGQIYPATQTDFAFDFTPSGTPADATNGQINIASSGGSVFAPLSAGGSLTFNVNRYTSSGVVQAPLGALAVNAPAINLDPGSVLSVAGSGLVPYGSVSNGTTWTYGVPVGYSGGINDYTLASSGGVAVAPKGIALNAPTGSINAQAGSKIDVAGGGEVLGVGFVSGPGGTYDMALNQPYANSTTLAANTPNPFFALIPSRGTAIAPFDLQIFGGLSLDPGLARTAQTFAMGETITIGAGSPIPAGTYTIMPPGYAVLPGAYAVEAVSGYQNLAPTSSLAMPDGTTIVAGKLGFAGAGTAASLWSGYRVYSDAQFRTLSEFDNYYGGKFFAAAATQAGQVVPRLGPDSGTLQLDGASIALASTIQGAPASGGRGMDLAIDAPSITVADSAPVGGAPQANLTFAAATLSGYGAETLVLGALDSWNGGAVTLSAPVAAQSVTVQSTTPLSAGEVILSAANVAVAAGSGVSALKSQTPPTTSIALNGDGAGLLVSNGALPSWTRSNVSPVGTATIGNLTIGSGAQIQGTSVALDGSATQTYGSGIALQTAQLGLAASEFNLGAAPATASGLDLSPAFLTLLGSVRTLQLTSAGGVNVYGSATLGQLGVGGVPVLQSLTLTGPGISGFGAGTDALTIHAGHVSLDNSAQASAGSAGTGSGMLVVQSVASAGGGDGSITVAGPVAVSGFQAVNLTAQGLGNGAAGSAARSATGTGDLVFAGAAGSTAALDVAGGASSVAIAATRITAQAGVNAAINVPGALTLSASGGASDQAQTQLGASLSITAQNLTDSGRIDLPAGVVQIQTIGSAATDGVALQSGALIRVAGLTEQFASTSADVSAGAIRVASANGSITQDAGATLDLSGSGVQGDAGTLILSATQGTVGLGGTVLASAGSQARGANFTIEAGTLGNFSALANSLVAAAGKSTAGSIALRAANGNITLAAGDHLRAGSITLEADGGGGAGDGSVLIGGQLDASGSNGGDIAVYANDQIVLQGGSLLNASGTATGGSVVLSARAVASPAQTADAIVLQSGSRIQVSGADASSGGSVLLRAPRINGTDVALSAQSGAAVSGFRAGELVVDAVQVYAPAFVAGSSTDLSNGANLAALLNQAQADASTFMAGAAPSGLASLAGYQLRPGIEIDTAGAIAISSVLDFSAIGAGGAYKWRYGGSTLATSVPGELTLRAGGDILVKSSVSDGFVDTASGALSSNVATSGDSWSYTFTAGANLAAANANQTVAGTGNLVIGTESATNPVMVRTGTGAIHLNAGQDVILDNGANANGSGQQGNVVYTAGVGFQPLDAAGNPVSFPALVSTPGTTRITTNVALTEYGGDLSIHAGGDVLGTAADGSNIDGSAQTVTDWLLRGGQATPGAPTVWWTDFALFQQGFGVLGGGNLLLQAGGNVTRVGAVVAGNGYDNGTGLVQHNAGSLQVSAGGNVQQGLFYDQSGAFHLSATALVANPASNVAPLVHLAQGANTVNVQAREGATFDTPFNPTIYAAAPIETKKATASYDTQFFTFTDNSAFDARTAAGDIGVSALGSLNGNITAPNLELVSFSGSVSGNYNAGSNYYTGLLIYPAAMGQLQILAKGSVSQLPLLMSQAATTLAPLEGAPQPEQGATQDQTFLLSLDSFIGNGGAALHANDPASAEIVALTGSISGTFQIAKTTEMAAGQNIGPLTTINIQNSNADSVTRISAGNEINFVGQSNINDGINIDGAGVAQITSGGLMNLGTDGTGIISRGNLANTNLAPGGATLIVTAGAGRNPATGLAAQPDYLNLIDNFIAYDAFGASGSASGALNSEVVAQVAKDPALAGFVQALDLGLGDRSGAKAAGSAFQNAIAALSPAQLALGGVKLAAAIQVVNNQIFVGTANAESFAPAYMAFGDLFPALSNNTAALASFVTSDVFSTSGTNGAALQAQALNGLPTALVQAIKIGLAAPGSVNDPNSAYSKAVAAISPAALASGMRELMANVLDIAGQSRDALQASGALTSLGSPYAKGLTTLAQAYAPTTPAGLNDLQMDFSEIKTLETGSVAIFAPQGGVIVGQASPPSLDIAATLKTPDQLGIFTYGGGDIIGMARDSVNVFQSRVFTVAGGDIDLWSSLQNIDAGKGSRDLQIVPPPRLVVAANGTEQLDVSSTVTGSGIGALVTEASQPPSNINLMAPAGYVDAGEAGIRAQSGAVVLGTNLVLNAGNIQAASGVSGGAVVATPPPPAPPSTGTSAGERAVEEAQRSALAAQQAAATAGLNATHLRITGEFIGFEGDCKESTTAASGVTCAAEREAETKAKTERK